MLSFSKGENGEPDSAANVGNKNDRLTNSVLVCLGCGLVGICAIPIARSNGIYILFCS